MPVQDIVSKPAEETPFSSGLEANNALEPIYAAKHERECPSKLRTVALISRELVPFYAGARQGQAPLFPRAGSKLCWRKTASGMSVAWIGARQRQGWMPLGWRPLLIRIRKSELAGGSKRQTTHTRSEAKTLPAQRAGAPKSANNIFERAFES